LKVAYLTVSTGMLSDIEFLHKGRKKRLVKWLV